MPYSVEAAFSPAHELLLSLDMYVCKKMHKRIDLGTAWVQQTKSQLSPSFSKELAKLDKFESWHQLSLLAWRCPERTVKGFLHWLEGLSKGDLYERLSPWVNYFPMDLGDMREEALSLLPEWNLQYFSHLEPAILDQLQEEPQDIEALKDHMEPVALIEKVTGGLLFTPTEQDVKVILIPQYHAQPTALLCAFEGLTLCHYSSGRLPLSQEGEPAIAMTRKLRALSDRTRLKILHFLKTGPKAYMEIYQHMGMSKSTVHEHMLQLRGAGLVRSHIVGENSVAYSIREDAIGILNDELMKYLQ